jgi:hypothetical protein
MSMSNLICTARDNSHIGTLIAFIKRCYKVIAFSYICLAPFSIWYALHAPSAVC